MRILIVNAHSRAPGSQKSFQELLVCIKEILKTHNGLLEMKDEYIIRGKNNLDDFLYDEFSSFSSTSGAKEFDSLDLIVVSGDLHLLPWSPSNNKIITLLRMCLRVKKLLFAIGFGMQALIYLSASNMNYPINVLNGEGKGGKLGDIASLNLKPQDIKAQDYFLDNVTGDLYHFQHESLEWTPMCNIGLHHKKTAEEFNTIGKFVIKTPIYRPKKSIHNPGQSSLLDENVETKCFIKKICLKHWLFNDCNMEFVVPYKGGSWEVHSFNFTNKERQFDVLAESENGPMIIEFQRIIGMKFLLTKRYKETCQLFTNFIAKYAIDILAEGQSQNMSILKYAEASNRVVRNLTFQRDEDHFRGNVINTVGSASKTSQGFRPRALGNRLGMTPENPQPDGYSVFKHSGFASKMKGKFILDHNTISSHKVQYELPTYTAFMNDWNSKLTSTQGLSTVKSSLIGKTFGNENEEELSFLEPHRMTGKSRLDSIRKKINTKESSPGMKQIPIRLTQSMKIMDEAEQDLTVTKADARRLLYPELVDIQNDFEKRIWIPGNYTEEGHRQTKSMKVIRVSGTMGSTYQKKGPLPKADFWDIEHRSLRLADPYLAPHQIEREYQKKQDEKILGHKKFILTKGGVASFSGTTLTSPMNNTTSRMGTALHSRYQEW